MTDESNFGKFFVSQNAVMTLSHIENVTINSHTLIARRIILNLPGI